MKAIYLVRCNKESISETIKEYDLFSIFERGNSLKEAKEELKAAQAQPTFQAVNYQAGDRQ